MVILKRLIRDKKLNLKTKLAYGAGDLGPAITANISVFFLLVFFTNVAGIPAGLAGSILMVGKIWDAVNDPFVGVLTDKTESKRWGRRLPWLLYGAIPFGIFFFLQWIVPTTNVWVIVLVLRHHWGDISSLLHGSQFALYGNDSRINSRLRRTN